MSVKTEAFKVDYGLMSISAKYLTKKSKIISATKNKGKNVYDQYAKLKKIRERIIKLKINIRKLNRKILLKNKFANLKKEDEIRKQFNKEKILGRAYIDNTKMWQRECRFNPQNSHVPNNYSNEQLGRMKDGEKSEALFEKYFTRIFPSMNLFYSKNIHAPFCDAMICKDGVNILQVIEIKSSYDICTVPMNIKAYYAMKHGFSPKDGIIVSVLYDSYRRFTGKFYVCSMRQIPQFKNQLDDGRVVCQLVYDRNVDVS